MRILFLCTGNSCRSQMAEGFSRAFAAPQVDAWSAGTRVADAVNPRAVKVMAERGADISRQVPKELQDVPEPVDVLITLCDSAAGACPTYAGAKTVEHWGLPDPADATGTEEEILEVFRVSRNDIEKRVIDLLDRLDALPERDRTIA